MKNEEFIPIKPIPPESLPDPDDPHFKPTPLEPSPDSQGDCFWQRIFACILDMLLVTISFFVIENHAVPYIALKEFGRHSWEYESFGYVVVCVLILSWIYQAGFESSRWRATPAKMLFGLVVTDCEGRRLNFRNATRRYWAKIICIAFAPRLFFWWIVFNGDRFLHDSWTETCVIKRRK